jgi:hypothetical protein
MCYVLYHDLKTKTMTLNSLNLKYTVKLVVTCFNGLGKCLLES